MERPLRCAVAAGAISDEEAELIARTRIEGDTIAALAAEDGVPSTSRPTAPAGAERQLLFLGQGL